MNEAEKFAASLAEQASKAAGEAYRSGDYSRAWELTQEARDLDPGRAGLWDAHESRIKFAESRTVPLDELLQRRLERAGFEPDDPALQNWANHNAQLDQAPGLEIGG